ASGGWGGGGGEVGQRLVQALAGAGVVGQPLDLLGGAVAGDRLDRLDDVGVERPPPLLEQAAVGDFVGERVLEGVLEVGKEARLVEELGGLQMAEPAPKRRLG